MSRIETFDLGPDPLRIEVRLSKADLHLVPSGTHNQVTVELAGRHPEQVRVQLSGTSLHIVEESSGRFRAAVDTVTIRAPEGSSLDAALGTGDVTSDVRLGDLRLRTASGDARIGHVRGRCEVKTASGDVTVACCGSDATITTASGDVRLDLAEHDVTCTSASGDVTIGTAEDDVSLRTASGDLRIERFGGRTLEAKSMSGDLVVDVVPGRRVRYDFQSMTGETRTRGGRSEPDPDAPVVEIHAKSMSGDLVLGVAGS
ncbi:MAG: DUF4097 family beta strand repeat-containing protein [Nitriliruptorales bacterium]|nr:DUF4097 family beta strand repeat-containing protein [Nitriliruptorales bacterium]